MVSRGNSGQRRLVINTYDNNTNDDTAHLLPKNDNRRLRNRPPITQPGSFSDYCSFIMIILLFTFYISYLKIRKLDLRE